MGHLYKITDQLVIHCHSAMEKFRCQTFWTKEPETLEWIKTFEPDGVFLDIGANIGVYTLFAASLYRKMKILAVEPLKINFNSLLNNINANKFDQVIPLNIAISDQEGELPFHIINDSPGSSGSQLNHPIAENGKTFKPLREEKVFCTTVDHLSEKYGVKIDYLKIDIDGQEMQVLKGAENSLRSSIKSVLVELNPKAMPLHEVHAWMLEKGFGLDVDLMSLPNHSNHRRDPEGPLNFIYKTIS